MPIKSSDLRPLKLVGSVCLAWPVSQVSSRHMTGHYRPLDVTVLSRRFLVWPAVCVCERANELFPPSSDVHLQSARNTLGSRINESDR